ncbi:Putative succinate dehydrogenase cytochrome B subunit, mitochondrial precursor [Podospora comata]|uniref:Succinate dehydrogenase cytochrome B subunit, mitochondrial n=1 Tax=Podospora comata TaxID=48703 RepID=A0ABY6S2L3_PODCO|nr:Putative succinate dehydrogenase cytochrome B subunit, mitochondrial precursor [Podospora comata]
MIAQRTGTTALRRVAANPNAVFTSTFAKAAMSQMQTRQATTQKISATEGRSILDAQRLNRPVSPHLEIYDKQQTYFGGSIWQRFTGSGLSGGLYVFGAAYLAAPLLGWHLESASLVSAFGALPFAVKSGVKFLVAWPFAFHAFNGVRHLALDLGMFMKRQQIVKGGWYIWGASLVSGLYLAFFL